ncbi:hypothetical protein GP486_008161 [Trichoglossum hirsutum]|uniref:Uncharacterized protein n=1 Tax=Trichoglossum hirsutum TaxID=265104 RepID=A0A9P8IIY0_9PEZI|nr:hypothetical protein GP486_008161 [Trichoglossum hirsutum]
MASSPPKRRKTSPTGSIPIDATPRRKEPSLADAPHTAPGRASFLSPTKASLARFNPGLLERPKSAGGERPQGAGLQEQRLDTSAPETSTAANGTGTEITNGHGEVPVAVGVARGALEKQNGENSSSPGATVGASGRKTRSMSKHGLSAPPRRQSRAASGPSSSPKETGEPLATMSGSVAQTLGANGEAQSLPEGDSGSQVMKALQALAQLDGANDELEAQKPENTLQVPVQADETNHEREAVDPERAPKAPAQVDGAADEEEAEELELPPTPSQRGLADPIVTRPPVGLLNTPSKRPRRSRVLGEALASSPIRPRSTRRAIAPLKKGHDSRSTVLNPRPRTVEAKRRRQEGPESAERDGAPSPKRRKRDDLRVQLRKLQDEVAMYEKEVEQARETQMESSHPPVDPTNEEDRRKIM